MKPYIITIARQYGSGGKTVGKMLADRLHIPYYNREIITMASEDSGINAVLFSDERLKPDLLTRLKARYKSSYPLPSDSSSVRYTRPSTPASSSKSERAKLHSS